jgi:hypothetical protein
VAFAVGSELISVEAILTPTLRYCMLDSFDIQRLDRNSITLSEVTYFITLAFSTSEFTLRKTVLMMESGAVP